MPRVSAMLRFKKPDLIFTAQCMWCSPSRLWQKPSTNTRTQRAHSAPVRGNFDRNRGVWLHTLTLFLIITLKDSSVLSVDTRSLFVHSRLTFSLFIFLIGFMLCVKRSHLRDVPWLPCQTSVKYTCFSRYILHSLPEYLLGTLFDFSLGHFSA